MTRFHVAAALAVLLAGCMSREPAPLPPSPQGVKRIVVPKPVNSTQSQLVVDDPGWIDKVLSNDKKKTVVDVLASCLRDQLQQRGFVVKTSDPSQTLPTLKKHLQTAQSLQK